MNKKGSISCAIIGLGRIGSTLEDDKLREKPASHAGAVTACRDTYLSAGYDIDQEARKRFAHRWGVRADFDSALDMIRETRPDILHIATHEDSHLDYLVMAMGEKIPVVVLEKPVSDRLSKARKILRSLGPGRGNPTAVVVNHERRYSRDYLKAKRVIEKAVYGPLLSITGRLYMGRRRPVYDILLHDGTHLLDIIEFLGGRKLTGLRASFRGKDPATVYATAQSGEIAVMIEAGRGRDHLVFEVELSFARGRIRVGNGVYEELESRESTYYENMRSLYSVKTDPIGKTNYFSGMMEDAVRVFRDKEAVPVSSFADGVSSLESIQRLRRKLRR